MDLDFATPPVRYFVAVADEGGIERAAQSFDVVRPEALARAISELEAEIGLELLTHHAGGVTLTATGRVFLAKALPR